jgi:dolichol-phosphate mannosyltransferase
MDISVIIPIYNEEDSITLVYNGIKGVFLNLHKQHELIFVNDGSTDNSLSILKNILQADKSVKIISFDKNYGQTSALDAGFKHAKGEIIVTIDADLQYAPQDLLRIIDELERSDIDAVFGKRINRASGFVKTICSKVAVFVRNAVLRETYQDCSLAGYKKICLRDLVLYGETQVFIPALLIMEGRKIKEINVREYPRKYGKSKYGIRNRFLKGLHALLVVKWMKSNKLKYKIAETL